MQDERSAVRLFTSLVYEEPERYGPGRRVHILPPDVAHRIAAGEVIERPASAVKELAENSLDAGASRVEVEIEGGGAALIRVRDNGSGMSLEDALLAVERHSTSKIHTADDLATVTSLGFRGEALHAIAAVSSLSLTTCEPGSEESARVSVLGGSQPVVSVESHPPGTTVEARNLFLNLPVRRGFLGTERAEANAVHAVVEALALGRPDVGFWLRVDGRNMLALPPAADLRERVAQVHGLALSRRLIWLDDGLVWGLVSPISASFPTRRYVHVAVNGRVVDTDSFLPAIAKAYADLLPKGRHPAAFLRLEPGPGEVDVNVHPAKSAVRLRGGRSVYPLVVGAIRAVVSPGCDTGNDPVRGDPDYDLWLIGQLAGRFILAQEGGDLLIMDQHGIHERILYERLSESTARKPESLRSPAVARLPEPLADEVWAFEPELERLGFRFEPFGTDAVRVLNAPEGTADVAEAFAAAVEALAGGEDLAKTLACKGSTKFGKTMGREEMEQLLQEWAAVRFREICPHGRPIVRRVPLVDLLREFGRT